MFPLRGIRQSGVGEAEAYATFTIKSAIINYFKLRKVMSKKRYDEASVIKSLNKKNGVFVNTVDKVVSVQLNNDSIGNGSWGKIDYLCHYCGYFLNRVLNLPKKKKSIINDDDRDDIIVKHGKINMAAMTKSTMKRVRN